MGVLLLAVIPSPQTQTTEGYLLCGEHWATLRGNRDTGAHSDSLRVTLGLSPRPTGPSSFKQEGWKMTLNVLQVLGFSDPSSIP